jgi:hypothetical protein
MMILNELMARRFIMMIMISYDFEFDRPVPRFKTVARI